MHNNKKYDVAFVPRLDISVLVLVSFFLIKIGNMGINWSFHLNRICNICSSQSYRDINISCTYQYREIFQTMFFFLSHFMFIYLLFNHLFFILQNFDSHFGSAINDFEGYEEDDKVLLSLLNGNYFNIFFLLFSFFFWVTIEASLY